ncbi:MAG: alpha/beta fold hydrolase [Myxococcales bacterium]
MNWTEEILDLPHGPVRTQSLGEGPVFLWTHGVFHPIDVDDFTPVPRALASLRGWRVVRYDTRGHGRTPAAGTDEAHRWDRLGEELLQLADALGAERFAAGGISMGAAVSLHAAVRRPDRVQALALLAPPTGWETRPPQLDGYRALAALGSPEKVAEHIGADLERDLGSFGISDSLRRMVEGIRLADWTGLGRVLRAAAESDLPAKEDVARLELPAVVLPWENDAGHPLETARAIAERLPHAELRIVQGVEDADAIRAGIQQALDAALARTR